MRSTRGWSSPTGPSACAMARRPAPNSPRSSPACPGVIRPLRSPLSAPMGLSLSRVNHRLPEREANTAGVQGPADVQHDSTATLRPQTEPVLAAATTPAPTLARRAPELAVVQRLLGHRRLPRP